MYAVDTLKAYETLVAARLPEEQARAILEVVKTIQETSLEKLATKAELQAVKNELKAEISSLRTDMEKLETSLRADMEKLESRLEARIENSKISLLKWLIPILTGQTALIIAMIRLLR